jgi:hypothetical protein
MARRDFMKESNWHKSSRRSLNLKRHLIPALMMPHPGVLLIGLLSSRRVPATSNDDEHSGLSQRMVLSRMDSTPQVGGGHESSSSSHLKKIAWTARSGEALQ